MAERWWCRSPSRVSAGSISFQDCAQGRLGYLSLVDPTGNAPVISRMSIWRFSSKLGIQNLAENLGVEPNLPIR